MSVTLKAEGRPSVRHPCGEPRDALEPGGEVQPSTVCGGDFMADRSGAQSFPGPVSRMCFGRGRPDLGKSGIPDFN